MWPIVFSHSVDNIVNNININKHKRLHISVGLKIVNNMSIIKAHVITY